MSAWRWLVGVLVLVAGRLLRRRRAAEGAPDRGAHAEADVASGVPSGREASAVAPGQQSRSAELVVALLLLLAGLAAAGFVVSYALFSVASLSNELLGGCIALTLAFIALALAVFAHRLVPVEEEGVERPLLDCSATTA